MDHFTVLDSIYAIHGTTNLNTKNLSTLIKIYDENLERDKTKYSTNTASIKIKILISKLFLLIFLSEFFCKSLT